MATKPKSGFTATIFLKQAGRGRSIRVYRNKEVVYWLTDREGCSIVHTFVEARRMPLHFNFTPQPWNTSIRGRPRTSDIESGVPRVWRIAQ